MEIYRLDEPHDWGGWWWLPDSPAHRIPGTLHFDPSDGITLQLFDPLDAGRTPLTHELSEWKTIHGVSAGINISIFHTFVRRHVRSVLPEATKEYEVSANVIVVGAHVEDDDAEDFSQCELEVENLTAWAPNDLISIEFPGSTEAAAGTLSMARHPTRPSGPVDEEVRFSLTGRNGLPSPKRHADRVDFLASRASVLQLVSASPKSASEWREYHGMMMDLVTFALGKPSGTLAMRLISGADSDASLDPDSGRLHVLFRPSHRPTGVLLSEEDYMFSLLSPTLEEFPALVNRWARVRRELAGPISILVGRRYKPDAYIELQAIALMSAAEAMHKKIYPHAKSKDGKDLYFRDRLLALHRGVGTAADSLIQDPERWATDGKKVRNDIAHEAQAGTDDLSMLSALVRATDGLLMLVILSRLGASDEQLEAAVDRARVMRDPRWSGRKWWGKRPPPNDESD